MRKHIVSGGAAVVGIAMLSVAPASACSGRNGCSANGYYGRPIYPYLAPPPAYHAPPVAYYAPRPVYGYYAAPPIYAAPVYRYVRPPYSYATYRLFIRRSPL